MRSLKWLSKQYIVSMNARVDIPGGGYSRRDSQSIYIETRVILDQLSRGSKAGDSKESKGESLAEHYDYEANEALVGLHRSLVYKRAGEGYLKSTAWRGCERRRNDDEMFTPSRQTVQTSSLISCWKTRLAGIGQ
jgi:hypothetical protein